MTKYYGIDLAWGEGSANKRASETGVVCLRDDGRILDAGWTVGIDETVRWIMETIEVGDTVAIDAPLVVINPSGMRDCERQVGQRYGKWKVSANSTNLTRTSLGGVKLRERLENLGLIYDDGVKPLAASHTNVFECYPYTAIVGAEELGYDIERPRYKRPDTRLPLAERRLARAAAFDELVWRIVDLKAATVPVDVMSHPLTADLANSPSPLAASDYKHREDLLDAVLCAWTAGLWSKHKLDRCQVLGTESEPDAQGRRATIIAPARPEQRR